MLGDRVLFSQVEMSRGTNLRKDHGNAVDEAMQVICRLLPSPIRRT
jgi:hypothetical protein